MLGSAVNQSDRVLQRLMQLHPKKIDLSLSRIERLLGVLGNPHDKLPPVIHVAGTKGKSPIPVIEKYHDKIISLLNSFFVPVYIDGADETTAHGAMIKGGGGALTREKIVAAVAQKFVCIVDQSKLVGVLGNFPLPVEVIPTASPLVARKLVEMGIRPTIRRLNTGSEFITDEGNLILDCECGEIQDPDALAASIRNIVGVVEHGLFLHMAERALVSDGSEVTTLFK